MIIVIVSAILLFIIICFVSMIVDTNRFVVKEYTVYSDKINAEKNIVLLADLHNKQFGKKNSSLLQAIDDLKPDFILSAGDMLTATPGKDFEPAADFMEKIAEKYPVYYGMGNHEYRLKRYPETYGDMYAVYEARMIKAGCPMLENVTVKTDDISVTGLAIDRKYYKRFKKMVMDKDYIPKVVGKADKEKVQILIAHNPEYFGNYAEWGADLVVSGHVHGGMMRLPFLGGVISPKCVLFPKYDGGEYKKGKTTMILSRGLGCHTIPVRVFNPGELICIHLKPCKS